MARIIPKYTIVTYGSRVLLAPEGVQVDAHTLLTSDGKLSVEESSLSTVSSYNAELVPTIAGVPYPTDNRNITGEVSLAIVHDFDEPYLAARARAQEEEFAQQNPIGELSLRVNSANGGSSTMKA